MSLGSRKLPFRIRTAARRRPRLRLLVGAALLLVAAAVAAQGPGRFRGGRGAEESLAALRGIPDGHTGFTFCRLMYRAVRSDPSGTGWAIEYPDAEYNFLTRLSQFTTTEISRWKDGEPGSTVIRATDRELFQCPFLMAASPGTLGFSDADAEALREYLLKGGFFWADDFWGEASWNHWESEISRVLPGYAIVNLTPSHPIFSSFYLVSEVPQIPALNRWRPGMSTSELGAESATPTMRGIFDEDGRLLVLMTHNTDIADGWERETDLKEFAEAFAAKSYGVGINVVIWVMSH